jgi:hypothetical protein
MGYQVVEKRQQTPQGQRTFHQLRHDSGAVVQRLTTLPGRSPTYTWRIGAFTITRQGPSRRTYGNDEMDSAWRTTTTHAYGVDDLFFLRDRVGSART